MGVIGQIVLGSGLLILCAFLHLALAAGALKYLRDARPFATRPTTSRFLMATGGLFGVFLLSHTVHIYVWAGTLWLAGALPGPEAPIYFALVTYTTLGYGDVTLSEEFRIFGAMASITGILMFGLTTAFLVGVFGNALASLDKSRR